MKNDIFFIVPAISSEVIPSNIFSPNEVTDDGIDIFFNDVQPLKASPSIFFKDDGIDIWINDVHWLKALRPIKVINEGKLICASFEQFWNKQSGIPPIFPVISSDVIPSNIFLPNEVTDDGIDTCFNDVHVEKTSSSIFIIDGGIVTCFNEEHPLKAFFGRIFKYEK